MKKKLYLLDMDGTLYIDETLFDGVHEFLSFIRENGGKYLFLTNNSSKDVIAYVEKMARLGISAERSDFYTSVNALISYLGRKYPERGCGSIYVQGTEAMKRQLENAGYTVIREFDREFLKRGETPPAGLLVSGYDTELTYAKLEDACVLLMAGVEWISANPDWGCPTWYGLAPDCGSVSEMLSRVTGRKPRFIGKPEPDMVLEAMQMTGSSPEETVMIGDRIYTDIASGVNAGIDTVLVMSGESTYRTLEESEIKPAYVYSDVKALLEDMKNGKF